MDHFNQKALSKLPRLAKIGMSDEEQKSLLLDLEKILSFMEQLQEIDTEGVEPTYHVSSDLVNVMRDDDELESVSFKEELMDRKTLLEGAPEQVGGMIRVPPIL